MTITIDDLEEKFYGVDFGKKVDLGNGMFVVITPDTISDDPRSWDNVGTMVCWHNRYKLGDDHNISEPSDFYMYLVAEDWGYDYSEDEHYVIIDGVEHLFDSEDEAYDFAQEKAEEKFVILPLYLYDHSGITMSTEPFSCRWDSGQVGYIYAPADLELYGKKYTRKEIEKILEGEVEVYDTYIRGDVYCYTVYDEDGDVIDGCCGYYGVDEVFATVADVVNTHEEEMATA